MAKTATLTPEQVLAWMAENPDGLRLSSAQTALEVLNGPEVTAAMEVLTAALKINQDSAVVTPGQSRANGEEGSREALSRTVTAIQLGRNLAARRIERLNPAEPEASPTPPPVD